MGIKVWLFAAGALAVIATVVLMMPKDGDLGEDAGIPAAPREDERIPSDAIDREVRSEPFIARESVTIETPLARAERAVTEARSTEEAAQAALAQAEREVDDLEREIDAVERFVDDLVERGEDPARHAEAGMKKLRPVIERYETRIIVVEAADERLAEATARLEAARSELSAIED